MILAEARERSAKLRTSVATDGGRPAKEVEACNELGNDGIRGKGANLGEQWIAASMINTDPKGFASEREQIKANVLHGEAQVCGRRRSYHRIRGQRWQKASTLGAGRHNLFHIVDHTRPIIETSG